MIDKHYEKYCEISETISRLNQQKKVIGEMILNKLHSDNEKRVETQSGVITLATKTSYKFTPAVDEMKKKLKKLQDYEVKEGKAIEETSEYLKVTLR